MSKVTLFSDKLLQCDRPQDAYLGYIHAHDGEVYQMTVRVFKGEPRTNLLGQNWINCIPTLLAHIRSLKATLELKHLLQKHASLFGNENHPMADCPTAKFGFKAGATQKIFKVQPIPYATVPRVEDEFDRLIKTDVPDWVAPIILVLKSDGKIWICGDLIDADIKSSN